jgi:hypothetical protein
VAALKKQVTQLTKEAAAAALLASRAASEAQIVKIPCMVSLHVKMYKDTNF